MLKIKDNVDLKELEKFKFVINEDATAYIYDFGFYETLFINCNNHNLFLSNACSNIPNVVYNLIQAGLVEKVVEDNQLTTPTRR